MKKVLKIFSIILFGLVSSFTFNIKSQAASASISVSKSASQVVVGQTVKFTVKISSSSALGSWNFDVGVSGGSLVSGQSHVVDYASSANQKSKSYTYSVKATAKGTISVNVRNSLVYGFDENKMSVSNGSSSVKVITQAELEASYSDNNNLKSLTVDGYEIMPVFDVNTLEYSVELNPDVEKINVVALKADSTATVTGDGEIEVSEGDNKIEIVVVSQKGNSKTYILNAIVKDNNPIEVDINGKKLTVVKKATSLQVVDTFEETTIDINGQEVPGLYNEISNIYLVGLKDEEGNISLYVYDKDKDSYSKFHQLKSNNSLIFPLEKDKFDKKLIQVTIKILDNNIKVFKYNKSSKFSFIYGINLETGEEGWYQYDEVEGTFQRYNDNQIKKLQEQIKISYIIISLLGACLVIMIIILIVKNSSSRKKLKTFDQHKKENKSKNKKLKKDDF